MTEPNSRGARRRAGRGRFGGVLPYVLVASLAFAVGALSFRSGGHGDEGAHSSEHRSDHAAHEGEGASSEAEVWTCSMHPQIRQSEPGACPICGMALVPVEEEGDAPPPERVVLSERAKVLARLRTSEVRRATDPAREVPLLGRVEADETTLRTVTSWVSGRIDRLHVRVTGERVRAGQTIATLYSPDVLAAHQDVIAARRQAERMQGASEPARAAAGAALEAARDRLRLLGVPADRIRAMEAEEQPARQIGIQSPFAGTVIERVATEGAYVATGEPLYRMANLAKVWVQLEAYERDLASLRVGQDVHVTVEALPGETFEGRVAFIEPTLDPRRRTVRVRVEVENRQGRLLPGMFAQGVVQEQRGSEAERPLVVPRTAPLFTGRRSIVYVEVPATERPTYEARVVRLGARAGEWYPVLMGLAEGERVVTRGAFVLDADLQIRGGASMMSGPDDTEREEDHFVEVSAEERQRLRPPVEAYLDLQTALAADDLDAARKAARALAAAVALVKLEATDARAAWRELEGPLRERAEQVAAARDLEGARKPFETLSGHVHALLQRFGNPLPRPVHVAHCPMAAGRGATWIQEGGTIDNPYFGESMRQCGDFRGTVSPGASAPEAPPTGTTAPAPGGQ